MRIEELSQHEDGSEIIADIVVIGGGPAGLTLAREFFGHNARIVIIESGGLEEDARSASLNTVEISEDLWTSDQTMRRINGHGPLAPRWSHAEQGYGVRCRGLGGSSQAWAGKCASFDAIDFRHRSWIPFSGWPVSEADLSSCMERAAERLNLGPNINDDRLWSVIGASSSEQTRSDLPLRNFFWQFARSRLDQFDAMRFGPDFAREAAPNIRVLINATASRILTNPEATAFQGVTAVGPDGRSVRVLGNIGVLAASAIENPRLLLLSNAIVHAGLGNAHDNVGRYLLDHPATQIARFDRGAADAVVKRFGFQGVPHRGRMHMYMHGLALAASTQERENLTNGALFFLEEHAPDDPVMALKRLAKGDRSRLLADVGTVLRSPGSIAKAYAIKAIQSGKISETVQKALVDAVIKVNPDFAVRETLHRGIQHRLLGVRVEGIVEQIPDRTNRIALSDSTDALGMRKATVTWRVDQLTKRSLGRLGSLLMDECARINLPRPILADWIENGNSAEAPVIDMAHTMGTTRMAADPRHGVVDKNCQVHGVRGLFVAGGSIFPTGGHSNPTLMIAALSIRLADHIKALHRAAAEIVDSK
ncbi:GMC family oxidoreductase [Bradyrhizobium japonicum]|uniref:GMC oxidoreductase n=1 Tax=Bradyrhizobium japonicum TaxID=375 RepID=UPI001BAD73AE|nr:GMC family oxidoreductase [Bradyrhizobium japonicum]MBR0749935.1 GMC family oxidoreductase [Bradyrhizobium japonicum]